MLNSLKGSKIMGLNRQYILFPERCCDCCCFELQRPLSFCICFRMYLSVILPNH